MLNMDQVYDELEKTQELLTKEIQKINMKGDLTPGELNSLKEAVCVMEKILKLDMMIEEAEGGDDEDDEYSEYGRSYRRGGSYARGGNSRYNGNSQEGSYRRGRSRTTGRYMSRENGGNSMRGNSRHSLQDRMAANLEYMMDEAGSDFERQKIGEWIDKIRNAPEN